MSDQDLRALERAVEGGGGAALRLQLAAALERSGRRWEALEALLPARDDLPARREIGRALSWCGPLDRGCWLAAPPPGRAPEVTWVQEGPTEPGEVLATSPLGIAIGRREAGRVDVLDPDGGRARWSWFWSQARPGPFLAGHWPVQAGHALVGAEADRLVARDLWTGETLWEAPLAAPAPALVAARDGHLVEWHPREVHVRALPPAGAPGPPRWSRPLGGASHPASPYGSVRLGGGRLCVRDFSGARDGWLVFDLAGGELLAALPGQVVHADAGGLLLRDEEGISGWDAPWSGPDWRLRGVWHELATPRAVILEHHEGDDLWHVAHARRTGARLGLVIEVDDGTPLCGMGGGDGAGDGAGELVLVERGPDRRTLEARTLAGERGWSRRLPDTMHDLEQLIPIGPGRLVGCTRRGRWFGLQG